MSPRLAIAARCGVRTVQELRANADRALARVAIPAHQGLDELRVLSLCMLEVVRLRGVTADRQHGSPKMDWANGLHIPGSAF